MTLGWGRREFEVMTTNDCDRCVRHVTQNRSVRGRSCVEVYVRDLSGEGWWGPKSSQDGVVTTQRRSKVVRNVDARTHNNTVGPPVSDKNRR